MIIDFHTHCFADELAQKAIPVLSAAANITARTDGTLKNLKESMEQSMVDRSVVLPIATKPSQTAKINEWAASINNDEIIAFGSVHPENKSFKEDIMKIKEYGLRGIKLHPEYQSFYVDDKSMFPIYEAAIENNLIIVFHAGADLGYPPPYHCTPEGIKNVIREFTGGKFVAAHMGSFMYWDEVEKYLVGEDIWFDTSFCLSHIAEDQLRRIIDRHGYNRILFASDSPWTSQAEEVEKIRRLELGEVVEEAVLSGNAQRLLGM